mmetsp:Transcript_16873/g.39613  ORF Transcript_16873/g.39613 Transcript_16873/m.39613 type:complete len:326 (+) Transcript_16873:229-1206(+)
MLSRSMCACLGRSSTGPALLKWPTLSEDEYDERNPGMALEAAIRRPGSQAQAQRHLRRCLDSGVDPMHHVTAEQLGRVVRKGKMVDEFASLVKPDFSQPGWSTGVNSESGLWFGYRVDRKARCMHAVVVHDVQGGDPVRAAAGYCATDLFSKHSPEVQQCTVLAQSADCSLWNQVKEHSDDIVQVDLVNALDDPLGAVMLIIHAEPDGSPDFPFVNIPKPSRSARSQSSKQCMAFAPLGDGSMRMHVGVLAPLPDDDTAQAMEGMSREHVAKVMRPLVVLWPRSFVDFLSEHKADLVHWEAFSVQASFYALCRSYSRFPQPVVNP